MKGALLLALSVTVVAVSAADAGAQVARSPDKPRAPQSPPVAYPLPVHLGRVPTIGRLPLLASFDRLGTSCVPWSDEASMRRQGIARGWHAFGAGSRQSFVGLDARGRVRYVMDSQLDQMGYYRDREEVTIHYYTNGKVEVGRRGAWNIGHDAALSLPQVSGLFPSDTSFGYAFARELARHCLSNARQ